ncbi:MAG: hypothetical protein ACPGVB_14075, partial [Chitinophagales bacterium]
MEKKIQIQGTNSNSILCIGGKFKFKVQIQTQYFVLEKKTQIQGSNSNSILCFGKENSNSRYKFKLN